MHHGEFDDGIQPKECGIVQENHIIEIPTRVYDKQFHLTKFTVKKQHERSDHILKCPDGE